MQFTYLPETHMSFYPTIFVYINDAKCSTYAIEFSGGKWMRKKSSFGSSKKRYPSLHSACCILMQHLITEKGRAYKSEGVVDYLLDTYPEYLL